MPKFPAFGDVFIHILQFLLILLTLFSEGAIMFGDSLLPLECSLLVEELKHTSLCFQVSYIRFFMFMDFGRQFSWQIELFTMQCAHGRPTTVPLVNLEALHNQITKLGLMNEGSSNNKWHGLQRHKVCLERAVLRLNSAKSWDLRRNQSCYLLLVIERSVRHK